MSVGAPMYLPAAPVERLREARAQHDLDSVAAEHDAVLVASFLSTHYLAPDGRVVEVDHLDETEAVRKVTDLSDIWRVLVVAARS